MMNGNKTISGTLDIGVEFDGRLHRDFTLRLPTVGDEIDVSEDDSIPESGFRVALFARCLTALGSIPKEQITYSLLHDELDSGDFGILIRAADDLKKKRKAMSADSTTSAAPASGSGSTDTVKPASAPLVL
jgi:hypothetical protein